MSPPSRLDVSRQSAGHFYLPNLCRLGAVLPLILVGELLALALTVATRRPPDFDWLYFSLLSAEILWIVLLGAATLCWLRPRLRKMNAASGAGLSYLLLLLIIAMVATCAQWLLAYLHWDWEQISWGVAQHVTVGGIIAGLALRYFYLQQQLHIQQQEQLRAVMQAKFQSLQSRIRPHFLFNSMNIIASLIATDPETAETVVEDMSDLFRASLADHENEVALAEEIRLCERYLHIEQLRLGSRLAVDWQLDLRQTSYVVPSLCLQPLIENAIYHGVQPRLAGGYITIAINDAEGRLQVAIRNPYTERTKENRKRGNGMALDNLAQRLTARYGADAQFAVNANGNEFIVSFSFPLASNVTE